LATAVLGAHRKEERLGTKRRTAAPVTRDDAYGREAQYLARRRDSHAVDACAADHRDPVGRVRAGTEQGKRVVVQGHLLRPSGGRNPREQHLDLSREVGAREVDRGVMGERGGTVDSSLGGCLDDQAGEHVECGVEADDLVVGPRPARVSQ
jgi:hypothetical protein